MPAQSGVRTMTEQLLRAPGFTLDDRLRQVAGFQLFRRTSSWVANPTAGTTLHVGSVRPAASRTLVPEPGSVELMRMEVGFAGEIPALAVRDVE